MATDLISDMSWESLEDSNQSRASPSWNDVEQQISALGTKESGSVFLNASNGSVLSVGGSPNKGFLAFISCNDEYRYLLAPPEKRKGAEEIIIGFQPGEYPRRIIVDLDACIKVAHHFFKTGLADNTMEWTSDSTTVE
jgi:hypothetical protein